MPIIPQRQSLLGQTVSSIRASILAHDWVDYLPSERHLCEELKISRSTLRRALEKVQQEGLIREGSPGKRREISYTGEAIDKKTPEVKSKKMIWLTRLSLSDLPSTSLRLIAILQNKLAAQDCMVDVIRVPVRTIANPQQHMEAWLDEHPADVYILHWMTEAVQNWFQTHNPICCIIGSPGAGVQLPSVEIDSLASMRHAIAMLQRSGHQRIGLIREESQLVGEIKVEGVLHELAPNNFTPSVVSCPKDTYLINEALHKLWHSSERPPTALICSVPHLALYTMSWLQQQRISIPEDVSVIALRTQPLLEHFTPSIAHYSLSEERTVGEMIPRLLDLLHHRACATTPINLTPEFVDGESLR